MPSANSEEEDVKVHAGDFVWVAGQAIYLKFELSTEGVRWQRQPAASLCHNEDDSPQLPAGPVKPLVRSQARPHVPLVHVVTVSGPPGGQTRRSESHVPQESGSSDGFAQYEPPNGRSANIAIRTDATGHEETDLSSVCSLDSRGLALGG